MGDYISDEYDKLIAETNKLLEIQKQRKQKIQEAEIKQTEQEAINSKKFEVYQQISEAVAELSKVEDSDILASFLKKEVFDPIASQNEDCQIVVIVNYENKTLKAKFLVNPTVVPMDKIAEIKIIASSDYKPEQPQQQHMEQGSPEFEAFEKKLKEGKLY